MANEEINNKSKRIILTDSFSMIKEMTKNGLMQQVIPPIINNTAPDYTFTGDNIEEIQCQEGMLEIDKFIFVNAPNLKTIYLPDSIKYVSNKYKCKSDHSIKIIYHNMPYDFNHFELNDGRIFITNNFLESLPIDNNEYKTIITSILEKNYRLYLPEMDLNCIINNIEVLKKYGLKNNEIIDFMAKLIQLMSADISSIYQNFEYLSSERIIPLSDMKKIYFESEDISLEKIIKNYINNGEIPELLYTLCITPTPENQLELRDRLLSATTLNLLNDINDQEKLYRGKSILNRSNHNTIIELDNQKISSVLAENGIYNSFLKDEHFKAIAYPIYEKLNSYNKQLFIKMNMINNNIIKYYNTLKRSSKTPQIYNSIETATGLKNEFCGQILYGVIMNMFSKAKTIACEYKDEKGIKDKEIDNLEDLLKRIDDKIIRKKSIIKEMTFIQGMLANYFDNVDIKEVIENIITSKELPSSLMEKMISPSSTDAERKEAMELITNRKNMYYTQQYSNIAIKLALKIDPYSFDMLRSIEPSSPTNLELEYAIDAKKSGYLFDERTENIYTQSRINIRNINNTITNYIEYINNQISINKIPKEEKNNYLNNVRKIVQKYIQTSSENELFKLYRAIDLFLRTESEYIVQKDGAESLAKDIFDINNKEFDNNDRLLYCMYNLNRLAHDTEIISLKSNAINYYRIDLNMQNNINSDYGNYIKSANILSKYNLFLDEVFNLIDTKNYNSLIDNKLTEEEQINIIDNSRLTNNTTKKEHLSTIINALRKFKKISKQQNLITREEITKIRNDISCISNQYILFFETKNILQEEIIKRFSKNIEGKIEQYNLYDLNTLEKKQAFYQKHGFIMEIQDTPEGLVLAVYNPKFNEPFSLHIKNLSSTIEDNIYSSGCLNNKVIAHTKLEPTGLTSFNNGNIYSFDDKGFINQGGFYNTSVEKCLLYNYITFDIPIIKEKNDITLNNIIETINNNNNDVDYLRMVDIINKMEILPQNKFKLTNKQQSTLRISELLVNQTLKKQALELIRERLRNKSQIK